MLQPGARAPEFALETTPDQTLALSDFRGKPAVLAVCTEQTAVYGKSLRPRPQEGDRP